MGQGWFFGQEKGEGRMKRRYQIDQPRAVQELTRLFGGNDPFVWKRQPGASTA